MQPLRRAEPHQPVIGGVIVDPVEAAPLGVEGTEPRRVLVRLAPKLGRSRATGDPAEGREVLGCVGRPLPRDRLAQGGIGREQVHVGKDWALIQIPFRLASRGHGSSPSLDRCKLIARQRPQK